MKFLSKLRVLFRKEKLDIEMSEEMRAHLEMQVEENVRRGLPPDEARYAAQREFGGVEQIKERVRDQRSWVWLEQLSQDGRFACRTLRKNPGFTAVAVLTLAIGIGANTALFTALNAILLRPLPVAEADRLVYAVSGRTETFSFPFYDRLRQVAESFFGLAAAQKGVSRRDAIMGGAGSADVESLATQAVTGDFFSVLRAPALIGRAFGPTDDRVGAAEPVVVISHAFWQRRFAGDRAIIGKSLKLDGAPVTIVGVMPPDFEGFEIGAGPDLWFPLQLAPQLDPRDRSRFGEGVDWLLVVGRLRDGLARAQAQTEVAAIFRRQLTDQVAQNPARTAAEKERILSQTLELHSGAAGYVGVRSQFKQPLLVLMVAVGVVLSIVCTNVAGLLLARGMARQREFAVRAALGASRGRIVRQLVTESVLLALLGGAGGLVLAQWGTSFLAGFLAQSGSTLALVPDGRVLLFTIAVSLLTGVLFGLAPALRLSRVDLIAGIKQGGDLPASRSGRRLHPTLVVVQVALAVLLLASAGLFVRTLHNLRRVELGFSPEKLVSFSLDPGRWRPANPAQLNALMRRVLVEMENVPGVRSVSIGGAGLLSGNGYNTEFAIEGYTPAPEEELRAAVVLAGPRFFETLQAPLLHGREFTLADDPAPPANGASKPATVAILSEAMARKFFGEADPVGRTIAIGPKNEARSLEVIGVAKDTRYSRNLRDKTPLEIYLPFFGGGVRMPSVFYVRTEHSAAAIGAEIREVVTRVEPQVKIRALVAMDEAIDRLLVRERIIAQFVVFFSVVALLLASLGIYGILSYGVTQRTREIGVRIALGATLRDVTGLVLWQGMALAFTGGVLGIGAALGLTRFVAALLFGVEPADPITFVAVTALLGVVVAAACWLPARRAAKVDPMVALRAE